MEGPDPTKPKTTCQMCGSNLSFPLPSICPNCKADTTHMQIGGIRPRQPDPKGKQINPYRNDNIYVQKNTPIAKSNENIEKKAEETKKKKKKRLGDYKSDEFKMCKDEIMYSDGKNLDDKEVEKSCLDLAIDG